MNENYRYYCRFRSSEDSAPGAPTIELIEFDPLTREPTNAPEGIKVCQACKKKWSSGDIGHYVTQSGDVWNSNPDELRKHLAISMMTDKWESFNAATKAAKIPIYINPDDVAETIIGKLGIFLGIMASLILSWVIFRSLPVTPDQQYPQLDLLINVMLFLFLTLGLALPAIVFAMLPAGTAFGIFLYTKSCLWKIKYGKRFLVPSNKWEDYLPQLPELHFPEPAEKN